ncbi:hypothetical protein AHiyo8_48510 [Arthrobacter sp. Hiyo8]|uniref:hypothetical protein n=1 Tax=Arthrobacter sp. Hiyo1 TaxID=1588020 RepID=UPI0006839E0C|nr:hypothetical protein [Arthrobacter sp. Hiyo1]BAS16548.1 hypothetical protein AHiyo8_48510 [Arthrobacter sp. Hiyo8]
MNTERRAQNVPDPRVDALRGWAAAWGLGGAVNALEEIEVRHGITNEAVYQAGRAITEALESLGLNGGLTEHTADVYRAEP